MSLDTSRNPLATEMQRRPVGRPRDPVSDGDVEAWFTAELKDLYRRHSLLLEQVRRTKLAAELVDEVASIYRAVNSGELSSLDQAIRIRQAFLHHCVELTYDELLAADCHRLAIEDAGGAARMAIRVVSRVTGVSSYALRAHRTATRALNG